MYFYVVVFKLLLGWGTAVVAFLKLLVIAVRSYLLS